MTKACLVVSKPYQGNKIFDPSETSLNRDNCLAPFHALKEEFKSRGVELLTSDLLLPENARYILYNDMPKVLPSRQWAGESHLLILESPLVVRNSWIPSRLESFKKVYSWNDAVANGDKYIKVNYSFVFPDSIEIEAERKGFCCLISANKTSSEENELYSERVKAIRFFEENYPECFDLYGIGWDEPVLSGVFGKVVKKIGRKAPAVYKLFPFKRYSSYCGKVVSKKETLENYKFSICYENIHGLEGYITEKIFDSFFAGCIPIYWGADNINKYVPADCFVDRRQFESNEKLYTFLRSLSDEDCMRYRRNIQDYLKSDLAKEFEVSHFAQTIVNAVLEEK